MAINKSRLFSLLSLAALACVFLFPLWSITMKATQFPEGLRLDIWINQISGNSEHILQNVNRLNHYIGMKPIEPDSIPELQYFPLIVYILLGLGIITLLMDRAWSYLTWVITLLLLSLLAVIDFYRWLYDYGHNLSPDAPIDIPGGEFMPPLFGSKDMANFFVTSYPDWGSACIGFAIIFGALAYWIKK